MIPKNVGDWVSRAANGDMAAASELLQRLGSADQQEELVILRVLFRTGDAGFWRFLLEYLAAGWWNGKPLDAKLPHLRRSLQPKIRALFLTATDCDPSNRAREEVLMEGLASGNAKIAAAAIDLAGISGNRRFLTPLLAAARQAAGHVQLQAVRALGHLGDPASVPLLITLLHSDDELLAALARDSLVLIGSSAVAGLVLTLDDDQASEHLRWMAAGALARIGDSSSIPALVRHLDDANYGVRWVCAEGLIAQGPKGIRAVLHVLATKPVTPWLADACAHVLQHPPSLETKAILKPVVDAARSVDASWAAPTAAEKALEELGELEELDEVEELEAGHMG